MQLRPGLPGTTLCIAHIPLAYSDEDFKSFCQKYGSVKYAYVMRCMSTGEEYKLIKDKSETSDSSSTLDL